MPKNKTILFPNTKANRKKKINSKQQNKYKFKIYEKINKILNKRSKYDHENRHMFNIPGNGGYKTMNNMTTKHNVMLLFVLGKGENILEITSNQKEG